MDEHRNTLGAFLRARRELVKPEQVGLPAGPRRRVAGLRREEVALLAGISAEYYLRLEQGRDRHPSGQVLDSLASALRLDREGRRFLFESAQYRSRHTRDRRVENVPRGLLVLLSTINAPAFVMNKYRDVLAVSPLASVLEPTLQAGSNRLISLFTDPVARDYHPDWDDNTASVVAQLRTDIGGDEKDPDFRELIDELSARSDRFRELWARYDVKAGGSAEGVIRHPIVGDVELLREKLLAEPNDLILVIYHAEPGSESERQLDVLRRHAAG